MATRKKILFPRSDIPGRAPTLNEIDFGEIAINTHDGKAYIKRDKNGEVSIQSIGAEDTENVYYVSKSGVPGNDGKSLMNAFATLDSAVAVVFAKENFKFDEITCERDLHLIMDAVRYDMALGTNYGSITAGQSYKRGNAIKVTSEQLYQTRRSINEERLGMVSVPEVKKDATAKNRVASSFDEIIEILVGGTASDLEYPDPPIESQTDANTAAQAIIDNKSAIQDAVLDYLNDPTNNFLTGAYDATKCSRDVGLIVNAVARDLLLGTDYNTTTAGWAYNRANSAYVLSDQKDATIAGINFARDYIIALANVTSDTDIENLFKNVTDVIDGTQTVYPTINYPTTAGSTYQVADRATATTNLQASRQTLIDDTIAFITANYPGLGYDEAACRRDTGYIIDGLSHDVKYGGNIGTRINAEAYFVGTESQLGSGETTATIAAYNDLKTRINAVVLTAPEQTVLGNLIDEITGVLTAGNLTGLAAEAEVQTGGLTTTEFDAIQAGVTSAQEATIDYVNENWATQLGGYNAGKCARDVGLILDAVRRDLITGSDYWTITAGNSYLRANSAYVLSAQKQATIEAVQFARDQVKALTGVTSDATVDTLFERVIDILDGTFTTVQSVTTYPTAGTYASTRGPQRDAIVGARATLISDTIAYITANYPGLGYDQTACERDTGFLIDALVADLTYDGNSASRQAALAYYVGTESQLGSGEGTATVAAFTDLATRIKALVNVTDDADVDVLISIINDAITAGNTDGIPAEVDISTAGLTTTEFDAIKDNTLIIQNDVIDFVNDENIVGNFDQHKCERDTGLIIDAIALDLQNNTNYNSITAGLAYQRGNAQKVQDDQLQYTIDSINYLRDQINASGISSDSQTFVTTRIKEITELLEESSDYGKTDGDPINFTGSGSEDADKRNAANALIVNRRNIQVQTIRWIQENYDALEYDQDKCQRDVGYIVDALTHDILFDGSFATDTNARSYWVGKDLNIENTTDYASLDGEADVWFNQLGDGEIVASAAAYEQLKTIVNQYITTSTEEARVETLIDVIISSIQAADGSGITVTLPSITGESAIFYNNRSTLQEQVVFYANSVFPTYSYDQATCRRDVGYILDALVYDLKYGGNSATSIAMRAYFSIFSNGYADRLGNSEFEATIAAYEQLKSIIATYTAGTDTGNITKIQNLLDIIIHAIEQSRIGTFQLGNFFSPANDTTGTIYSYNYPTGLAVGYDTLTFPNLTSLGIQVTFPAIYTAWSRFETGTSERLTIIRQSSETAQNQGADSTIFLKSGDYTVNNPIKLPPKVSIIGDALRSTTIRPRNVDSDIFWVDNGCYVKEITFRDHQNGAACVAFDPRNDVNTGPFITQSPYVQNCTSLTTSGIGMKIDGSKVSGLKSMVLDAFTQFNADGIGVLLQNRAYAQLVSCFTISTSTSIKAETGAQCSITNSNSSFGDFGLVATGGSPSIYDGTLHADYQLNDDVIRVNGITNSDPANYSLNIGDFKTPNYNDAIKFANDSYYYTILNVSDEITQDWSTSGNTQEQQIIYNSSPTDDDRIGHSVDMSQDDLRLIIGAMDDGPGSAEIWTRTGTQWSFEDIITPQAPHGGLDLDHQFGFISRLSKNGDIAAVSAFQHKQTTASPSSGRYNGAIHLYTRSGSSWSADAFFGLTAVTDRDRTLGRYMDLSDDGSTLAATTQNDLVPGGQGAIYVWQRDSAGVPWSTDSSDAIRLTCPNTSSIGYPNVALSEDGTDLLAHWSDVNQIYYYQQNQDGVYILNQSITPKMNFNGIARDTSMKMNVDATYFAFGDRNPAGGYITNSLTDADNGAPSKYARKQKLDNVTFSGSTLTTTDTDADFTEEFVVGNVIRVDGATISASNYTVATVGAQTLTVTVPFITSGAHTDVQIYRNTVGAVELFTFEQGSWITQDIIEGPKFVGDGPGFGYGIDINTDGSIVTATTFNSDTDSSQCSILERAATSWSRVNTLTPQSEQLDAFPTLHDGNSEGNSTTVGGSGDYIAIGLPNRQATLGDDNTRTGQVFAYYSILSETGSYELTIAPPLNKDLSKGQTTDFHQRSLISASSHTFEFVGSGTNMFAAIPQNGGIPIKKNEIVFDSANSAQPNFGLVYFTATDELGDFRIGGELTINRESGTITGQTFDRSLFAVLTPYILALAGE